LAAAAVLPALGTFDSTEEHILRAREAAETAVLAEMQGVAYVPKFFNRHEYQTVKLLVDYIIPRDERSGSATDAGVPQYIDFVLSDQTPPPGPANPTRRFYVAPTSAQVNIHGGLAWLDHECSRRFGTGKTFLTSTDAQRREILDDVAWPAKAKPELSHGVAFFTRMRDMTASGFFSRSRSRKEYEAFRCQKRAGFASTPIAAPVSAASRVAAGRVGGKGVKLES